MPEAKENWRDGIDLMRMFMRSRPGAPELVIVDEYGTPAPDEVGYFIDPGCTNTIREHANYRSKAPIKGQNVPEMAQKISDHTIDAIRYALVTLFKLGAQYHLADVYVPEPKALIAVKTSANEFDLTPLDGGYFDMSKTF
jgi:hypothetical protein